MDQLSGNMHEVPTLHIQVNEVRGVSPEGGMFPTTCRSGPMQVDQAIESRTSIWMRRIKKLKQSMPRDKALLHCLS